MTGPPAIDDDLAACERTERRLLWKELLAIALVVVVVLVRALWLV